MALRTLPVPDGLAGDRVDAALARMLGFSRTRAAELAEAGAVRLDGRQVGKSDRVVPGGWLEVDMPEERPAVEVVAEPVPGMGIVYDDDDLVVIDKPVGVAAHPSPGWTGPTVVGRAASRRATASPRRAPPSGRGSCTGSTSARPGLMVVAKSELAYTGLKRAFKERTVDKIYHALAQGHPDPTSGTVDAPIGRHPSSDWKFAVIADGKPSVTHYETLEMLSSASLLEVHLETGRTHQIRVHLAALRHPLVGDLTYGADPVLASKVGLKRQWLHAHRLGFEHPTTGRRVEVESQYPADLEAALEVVRGAYK